MRRYFAMSLLILFGLTAIAGSSFAGVSDWLKEAYRESHTAQSDPYSSDVEAKDLFKNTNVIVGDEGGEDSVITRIGRFMLRVVVIIAIPLLLYVGIRIMLALGDSGKLNTAIKEGGMVLLGLLIALLSVAIIYIITSITRGSLGSI